MKKEKNRMSSREAAEYLGVGMPWLSQMRCYGVGPKSYKDGPFVFYNRDDLEAYKRSRKK